MKYFTFQEFLALTGDCVSKGCTTGAEQSPGRISATVINYQRMNRIYQTASISDEIRQLMSEISKNQEWIVISEAWCGDTAQILPFIARIADESHFVNFKIVLRDDNPDFMNQHLTNGSRSIPKLIGYEEGREIFTWGPRPKAIQEMVNQYKLSNPEFKKEEFEYQLHLWYGRDKGNAIQTDLIKILKPVDSH